MNVFTPQPAGKGHAVMVWIHGGALHGESNDYNAAALHHALRRRSEERDDLPRVGRWSQRPLTAGVGTDVAIETVDVVLMSSEPLDVATAVVVLRPAVRVIAHP